MIKNFQIQNTKLFVNTNNFLKNNFTVKSFPRNYEVKISNKYSDFKKKINDKDSIIIIDRKIFKIYFSKGIIQNKKIIKINVRRKKRFKNNK